jgi:antitoxin component YwqK of YwqJK toxin-antitoxin module
MNKVFKIILGLLFTPFGVSFAQFPPMIQFHLDLELKHRQKITLKEEKYYKNGKLDSVYRKWNIATGQKLTEGYYIEGKRHGEWTEWLSNTSEIDYFCFTYVQDNPKKLYRFSGWLNTQNDTIKSAEHFYTFGESSKNFTVHMIDWNSKLVEKKNEEKVMVIEDNIHSVSTKIKRWRSSGLPWETEEKKKAYDDQGNSLGVRKHGYWAIWNKDGTLQKETWYDMGKVLRQKLYEHGKLVSDKKY